MHGYVYFSTSEVYKGVKKSLLSSYSVDNDLLHPPITILTREKVTVDYLSIKFAKEAIPSMAFNIIPFRQAIKQLVINDSPEINADASIFLIASILGSNDASTSELSAKGKLVLAREIFSNWEKDILAGKEKLENQELYQKFTEKKHKFTTPAEWLALAIKNNSIKSNQELKLLLGENIILYSLFEMEPIIFSLWEKISKVINLEIHQISPFSDYMQDLKIIAELPENNILRLLHEINAKVTYIKDTDVKPVMRFLTSMERYREIEYIGRDILKTIKENEDNPDFKLTSIKVCLPGKDEIYFSQIKNTFSRLGIPTALTMEIAWKTSPYFTALQTLIELIGSDYNVKKVFRLLRNSCFHPLFIRGDLNIRYWQNLATAAGILSWMDPMHKRREQIRDDKYQTWEDGFKRVAESLLGLSGDPIIVSEHEEDANQFIMTASSLLNDLEVFLDPDMTLLEKTKFLKVLLETYLDSEASQAKALVFGRIEAMVEMLGSEVLKDAISSNNFKTVINYFINNISTGGSGIIKKGVVVGTLKDTTDPSFAYIYCLGLGDKALPDFSTKEMIFAQSSSESNRGNKSLLENAQKSRIWFYHLLKQNAKEISFSYVNLDTVKDRPIYPSSEYLLLLNQKNEFTNLISQSNKSAVQIEHIPLFSFEEINVLNKERLVWEPDVIKLHKLLYDDSSPARRNKLPQWAQKNDSTENGMEIYQASHAEDYYTSLLNYFYRKRSENIYDNDPGKSSLISNILPKFERKFISFSQLTQFIICPAKYYYTNVLGLEEEVGLNEESYSIDYLQRNKTLRYILSNLLLEKEIELKTIFNESDKRKGIVPIGVNGAVEESDWLEIIADLKNDIPALFTKEKIKIIANDIKIGELKTDFNGNIISFAGPAIINANKLFSSQGDFDKKFSGSIDYLIQGEDGVLYLSNLSVLTPANPGDIIKTSVTAQLLNGTEELNQILKVYNLSGKVIPAIIHYDFSKNKLSFRRLNLFYDINDIKIYNGYIFWLLNGYFPFAPLKDPLKKSSSCNYCGMKDVCFAARQDEFEEDSSAMYILLEKVKQREKTEILSENSDA